MDDDVLALARAARLVEAAELAAARGDAKSAASLFEQACDWGRAARERARAGERAHGAVLAARAGDEALGESLVAGLDAPEATRVAPLLAREGAHGLSAIALERAGQVDEAARAWVRAGSPVRAAAALEGVGDVIGASRVLEAATRREPARADVSLALGALYSRFGKTELAVASLQRVSPSAPERRRALTLLAEAFSVLQLPRARADVEAELAALGGPETEAPAPARGGAPGPARIFGRYEVARDVASSASARVFECVDPVRGERVAVKVFAGYDARGAGRDALARFEREVRILAKLDHPSLVPLRDYVAEGPALVLAWMSGGTLETRIAARALTPARAVDVASSLLSVLGEAHRLGIVHRDVKPANVLFDDAGGARLADFGVAHLGDASATATAGVIGTLAYMSPEQREGKPATAQSDVYAVGALVFEMLTGSRFGKRGDARLARPSGAHRDLDARHDDAVLALLASDPADRPHGAFEARRLLLSLAWPDVLEPAAPMHSARAPSDRPDVGRAELRPDGTGYDRWVERPFEHVPLDERALERASAFARAAHPSLQRVLRVDRAGSTIWLAPAHGSPARAPLTRAEVTALEEALAALHALGIAHGSVDEAHVLVDVEQGALLRFTPSCEPTATLDRDRLALARLAGP